MHHIYIYITDRSLVHIQQYTCLNKSQGYLLRKAQLRIRVRCESQSGKIIIY